MRATGGTVSWSEAKAMPLVERKAFLYTAEMLRGMRVDWSSGRIYPPPKEG